MATLARWHREHLDSRGLAPPITEDRWLAQANLHGLRIPNPSEQEITQEVHRMHRANCEMSKIVKGTP